MARSPYTPEQRDEALRLYRERGPAEAGRRTGIRADTISEWARRAGIVSTHTRHRAAHIQARRQAWAERRLSMADDLGEIAGLAFEQVKARIDEATAAQAADILVKVIDKAQLLTGEATERGDHRIKTDAATAIEAGRARLAHLRSA
jgi:hypothetical protein